MMARPPVLARVLLQLLLPVRDREFILGDLEEEFAQQATRRGRVNARRWYWRQALGSVYREARYALSADAVMIEPGQPRRGSMFDVLRQDFKYAIRSLNRRPVFTVVAVVTLALGIGANTAVFSIANWLLLRPVPGIADQDRLAVIEFAEAPGQNLGISWLNLRDLTESTRSFSSVIGYTESGLQVSVPDGAAQNVNAHVVAGDYFGSLGVVLQAGRAIHAEETVPGNPASVAVISDALWAAMFGRDAEVIGRTFVANRITFTVIGVAAAEFRGVERHEDVDAWLPYSMYEQLRHFPPGWMDGREARGIRETIGRLAPGVSPEAARAEWQAVVQRLIAQFPDENVILGERPVLVHEGIGVRVISREYTESAVRLMLLVVFCLLLISTANVANMLLVRGLERAPDTAVRRLMGASSGRLISQQLAESLVLTITGGVAGLVLARLFLEMIEGGRLLIFPPIADIPLDARVLSFTFLVSLLTGLAFALLPLLSLRRHGTAATAAGASGRFTPRASWMRSAMVSGQTALSLALLIAALLLGRTLQNLMRVDLGFEPEQAYSFVVDIGPQGYTPADLRRISDGLLHNLATVPGIEAAGLITQQPFACCFSIDRVSNPHDPSGEALAFYAQYVSGQPFDALGATLIRGRVLNSGDQVDAQAADRNVVLSETAAQRLFAGREPVGQTLSYGKRAPKRLHVVGVVGDVRQNFFDDPKVTIYQPLSVYERDSFWVTFRARNGVNDLYGPVQRALAAVDPAFPMGDLIPANLHVRNSIAEQRLFASMLNLFSVLGVLLAAVGLYGVLGVSVSQRTREIGIRMALGAPARRIASLIVAHSATMIVAGLAIGLVVAYWLGKLLESRLFGVAGMDPLICAAAVTGFAAIAAIATGIPTRKALTVEPSTALRQE